ncbi:hypothetical protein [Bradyrhizobium sp. LA2.1]|uniref:hypothetical protein n=1 Tax=Bradyrhizobium sp. LA2.1 TaxID=3156376 RepID=UPI003394F00E
MYGLSDIELASETNNFSKGDRNALLSKWLLVESLPTSPALQEQWEARRRFGNSWQRALELHEQAYVHSFLLLESFRGSSIYGDSNLLAAINFIEEARASDKALSSMPALPPTPAQLLTWCDKHSHLMAVDELIESESCIEDRSDLLRLIARQPLWERAEFRSVLTFSIALSNEQFDPDLSFVYFFARTAQLARELKMPVISRDFAESVMYDFKISMLGRTTKRRPPITRFT